MNSSSDQAFSRQKLRAYFGQLWKQIHQILDLDCQGIRIGLCLVDEKEGQAYNQSYRQKNYATNILTFEYGKDEHQVIQTDMILCMPVLRKEAKEQHKTFEQHTVHLLLHGLLHALGFDHLDEEQAQEMESLEVEILNSMGYPNPYE
ncbi:hypothetical protein IX83_06700 [Basilea psittacipulmonis DSM 24701]|uniref:Endoribonuclease YbeY n=1 Tax=Basilea psittacipulmonis DSM 24701 TaxID=1072685 RepID=A0A077DFS8_9BURK|nr:hypothetical protein IX83_06700 [Basilea psittacipulmonis DSM 24701]